MDRFQQATALHAAGRVYEAATIYKQIVRADPGHAAALHRLGTIAHAAGHHADAERLIARAVTLQPDDAEAHVNLGVVRISMGRPAAAADCYRVAIALRPSLPAAHNNLGNALQQLGQADAAIDSYRRAIALDDTYAAAHGNLGHALLAAGRIDEAVTALRRAVALRPGDAASQRRLAIALAADPAVAMADGERLWATGRPVDAAAAFRRATALDPAAASAWFNLSVALVAANDPDAALAAVDRAAALRPDHAATWNHRGTVLKDVGRIADAIVDYRRAVALDPSDAAAHSNLVYARTFDPAATAADVLAEARGWAARHAPTVPRPPRHRRAGPLRVGYVSPDFRDHVVGRNLLPLLRAHDRSAVEVFCYATVARPDAVTAACQTAADVWRDLATATDDAAADRIRADGIDVLIDLSLHLADNRLPLFARRPAPVQVTFGGYPGTTGLGAIDVRLTDPYLDPPGTDGQYAERSIRLPHSFWCYDPAAMGSADQPPPGVPPAVANGFVTFGCLNHFGKVNDGVLAAWRRVLDAVPRSRLTLLAPPGDARDRVGRALGPARVTFVPVQPRADYLATYRGIDLALDTFPYNGHSTSLDGLWQGVPTVTLVGGTVVGRAGWSQLSNLSLTELAAADVPAFVVTAAALAGDLPRLTGLRRTLRDRMVASPLCDAAGFARGVEAAYRTARDG